MKNWAIARKWVSRIFSIFIRTVPTYNAVIIQPFLIDEQTIIQGLTAENVGEASVAELYCLVRKFLAIKCFSAV